MYIVSWITSYLSNWQYVISGLSDGLLQNSQAIIQNNNLVRWGMYASLFLGRFTKTLFVETTKYIPNFCGWFIIPEAPSLYRSNTKRCIHIYGTWLGSHSDITYIILETSERTTHSIGIPAVNVSLCSASVNPNIDSYPPSTTYMRQWIGSALVQVMACRLVGNKQYPNHCWPTVNWSPRNKFQWNLKRNTKLFIHVNAFVNVVCQSCGHFVQGRWVNICIPASMYCRSYSDTVWWNKRVEMWIRNMFRAMICKCVHNG